MELLVLKPKPLAGSEAPIVYYLCLPIGPIVP